MGILLLQNFVDAVVVAPIGADGTLLALQPDAGASYSFEYRTDVHKSWNGIERRVALLGYPRESFEASFLIDDEATFRALRSHRTRFPTDPYLMVVWHEGATVQGAITSTSAFISIAQVDWAQAGRRVWVEGPNGLGYSAVIQTVLFGSPYREVLLDQAPPGTFPDGSAVMYPLRAYYLEDSSPVGRYAMNAGTWSVKGRSVEPFTNAIGTGATINTLGGIPLLDVLPIVRGSDAEDRPVGDVEMLDAGARISPEWSFDIADIVRIHTFVVRSSADRQWWKSFIHTAMGRQKVFLLPTYRPDIEAISIVGDTILAAYNSEAGFTEFAGHRWIRIVSTTGTVTTHEVYTSILDGDQISLGLTPAPPALASVAEIQWIEKVRFAEDRFVWTLNAGGMQEMTLRFLVVRQ
jgi:hypothetical protein